MLGPTQGVDKSSFGRETQRRTMDVNSDYYEVLQVHRSASQEVIRAAYRTLAQRYHPDSAGPSAMPRMIEVNAAYEILGDPTRRAAYDRERRQQSGNGSATGGGSSPAGWPTHGQAAATPTTGHGLRSAGDPWWTGSAGRPPGRPFGSVLAFGRHKGWSLGEVARFDPGYLEWLEQKPEGRRYLDEIDDILVKVGFRATPRRDRGTRRR
jgi:curved DNA-binding protein CbpA